MREWLSGGAPPCQGGGRGFDPRLALEGGFRICTWRQVRGFLFLRDTIISQHFIVSAYGLCVRELTQFARHGQGAV